MFSSLKNLSTVVSPSLLKDSRQKKSLINEARCVIEAESNHITAQLDAAPADRLPSVKLMKAIKQLKNRVDAILVPIDLSHQEVEGGEELQRLEIAFKQKTLQRYTKLISESKELRPFVTYNELYKSSLIEGERDETLYSDFQLAVRSLYTHALFEATLLGRVDKKMKILAQNAQQANNLERELIELFVADYDLNKSHNGSLVKNDTLELKMKELEAVVFFQEQTEMLQSGQHQATDALVDYINHWMGYLNELSETEQLARLPLIEAADLCSQVHNSARA